MNNTDNLLASDPPEKIKVLVVDDSKVVRIAASKMFGEHFNVILAIDGADGWNIIENDPEIQVVFTDLVMPEMDGFELLKTIRSSDKDTISNLPVIVATGADNPEIAKQKAISLGATDFITKPFDAAAIQTRALSYARLQKANQKLKEQITVDVLTGLMNNKGLSRQLEKEIAFVNRHKSTLTTMTIQVDSFKDLFIRVGRAGSETIITKVSEVITSCVRKEDTVARTGVATFVVSMPLAVAPNTMEIADRICNQVEKFRAKLGGKKLDITVSIGVCALESHNESDAKSVLEIGEQALLKAQGLGRSQIAKLTISEYRGIQAREAIESLSIDQLLGDIKKGRHGEVMHLLDTAIDRLIPLFAMLSPQQKQRLLVTAVATKIRGLPEPVFNLD
jgi:diguanylate cyclase (GGDEF)-like protein